MTEREWVGWCTDPQPMLSFLGGKASGRKLRLFGCACVRRVWHLLSEDHEKAIEVTERHADGLATEEEMDRVREALGRRLRGLDQETTANSAAYWALSYEEDFVSVARLAAKAIREATSSEGRNWLEPCPRPEQLQSPAEYSSWLERVVGRARFCYESATPGGPNREALCRAFEATLFEQMQASDAGTDHWAPLVAGAVEQRHQCDLLRDLFGNPWRTCLIDPTWLPRNDCCVVKAARGIYDERRFVDLPVLADALEEAGCADAYLLGHLRGTGPHVRGCWVVDLLLAKE
jgi:hypothetical protein